MIKKPQNTHILKLGVWSSSISVPDVPGQKGIGCSLTLALDLKKCKEQSLIPRHHWHKYGQNTVPYRAVTVINDILIQSYNATGLQVVQIEADQMRLCPRTKGRAHSTGSFDLLKSSLIYTHKQQIQLCKQTGLLFHLQDTTRSIQQNHPNLTRKVFFSLVVRHAKCPARKLHPLPCRDRQKEH